MPKDDMKWEKQSDPQKIEQLRQDLDDALLAIKNLTHDVGRLAARQTTTESSMKELADAFEEKGKRRKDK